MSEEPYEETIFEFADGLWWSIEEDPSDIGYEYEVPFTKDPAKMWTRIDHLKRHGWKVKNPPESSDRIVLFKGTPPVSEQGDVS
jgi:hypothetical protein